MTIERQVARAGWLFVAPALQVGEHLARHRRFIPREGVQPVLDLLKEFDDINNAFGDPDAARGDVDAPQLEPQRGALLLECRYLLEIRRHPAYLDWVEQIWHELRGYLER